MKKLFFLSVSILMIFALQSCNMSKDEKSVTEIDASVEVAVKDFQDTPLPKTIVYLYKDKKVDNSTISSEAKLHAETDENGIAHFDLNFSQLNILEGKTALYFGVFYKKDGETLVAGSTKVTMKKKEQKHLGLTVPV